jgi:hypothetical protein
VTDYTDLDADDELGASLPWGWIACMLIAGACGLVDVFIR